MKINKKMDAWSDKNGWLTRIWKVGRQEGRGEAGGGRELSEWPATDSPCLFPSPAMLHRHFYWRQQAFREMNSWLGLERVAGEMVEATVAAGGCWVNGRQRRSVFQLVARCSHGWRLGWLGFEGGEAFVFNFKWIVTNISILMGHVE